MLVNLGDVAGHGILVVPVRLIGLHAVLVPLGRIHHVRGIAQRLHHSHADAADAGEQIRYPDLTHNGSSDSQETQDST